MTFNIQQLSDKRKKWVEANRENRFEDGIKRLLTDLYPDNAHFIYELLQNAEDAKATEVRFILNDDAVEFEHNGDRLFSIEDVEAITSIGVSVKRDETTSIGKFGVGFKAVFAYTTTPEIKSGEYHFRIRDMVVPDADGLPPRTRGEKETRFVFPFDNPKKPPERARDEIEINLRQLDERTLLFLRNIRKIEYLLPDLNIGFLMREEPDGNRVKISIQHPENPKPTSAVFFRFEKVVNVNDEDGKSKSCRVAVAFSTEKIQEHDEEKSGTKEKQDLTDQWRIKPLFPGQVFIYFPAEKETSNLRFHLHAPFASTVARDSVRECSANEELRDHLKVLIVESMSAIRDQGLLTVRFLATLPNDKDNVPSFYLPIQERLIAAFQNENLTPMKRGGHAPASGIYRGTTQLSNLINDEDLAIILGEDSSLPLWVANPPQLNQREDNFLSTLNISEWTTEDLVGALLSDSTVIVEWLKKKSDEWHQQMYALLGDFLSNAPSSPYYIATDRKNKLSKLRIVRLSEGTYNIGSKCYFSSDSVELDEFPCVAKGVYLSGKNKQQQEKALKFLEDIGVCEIGEAEQVETILKQRYTNEVDFPDNKIHFKDIERFIALVEKEPQKGTLFRDHCVFELATEKCGKPSEVYLDLPYLETFLSFHYEMILGETDKLPLSPIYLKSGIPPGKIGLFAKALGAQTELEIKKTSIDRHHPEYEYLRSAPGEWLTDTSIDQDYVIHEFKSLLLDPTVLKSKLVWFRMSSLPSDVNYLQARFRRNRSNNFHYAASQLVHDLRSANWIPQKNGKSITFVKPCNASVGRLPEGFPYDVGQKWLEAVEFGTTAKRQSEEYGVRNHQAKTMGFASADEAEKMAEVADLCRQQGKSPDDLILQLTPNKNKMKPSFPNKMVGNPERRQERVAGQLVDALEKEYEGRERSVRKTRGSVDPAMWLRNHYTNEADQMVCQICKEEMPFKKRDGEYYFEAVEALSRDYFIKEHEAQFLALCPLCAAMYRELVKLDKSAMEDLSDALKNSGVPEVSLNLGGLIKSLRFVESHYQDIKTILGAQE